MKRFYITHLCNDNGFPEVKINTSEDPNYFAAENLKRMPVSEEIAKEFHNLWGRLKYEWANFTVFATVDNEVVTKIELVPR